MNTECIEAKGPRDKDGYVRLGYNRYAHRVAWESVNGPQPKGMMVCHTCDNPPCINLDHLFLGTNQDNQNDYFNKNKELVRERGRKAAKKQWENPEFRAKMTEVLRSNADRAKGSGKSPNHNKGFQPGHKYFPGRHE